MVVSDINKFLLVKTELNISERNPASQNFMPTEIDKTHKLKELQTSLYSEICTWGGGGGRGCWGPWFTLTWFMSSRAAGYHMGLLEGFQGTPRSILMELYFIHIWCFLQYLYKQPKRNQSCMSHNDYWIYASNEHTLGKVSLVFVIHSL